MALQTHKIMRQVLELRGCAEDEAPRLQSELRELYYRRLVPLIDKACSELGAHGRIERIESLEIDLGTVPLEALEGAMAERLEAALHRSLAAAIGQAPVLDAELELIAFFLHTGAVPWWADRAERALLATSLESLMRRAPQALRRAVQAAPDPERVRRRLALAFSDRLLERLADVLAQASLPPLAEPWIGALESASVARGHPARAARNLWWQEVLHALQVGSTASSGMDTAPFFRSVLVRVARRLGIDYPTLVADLQRTPGLPLEIVSQLHPAEAAVPARKEAELRHVQLREKAPAESAFSDADAIHIDNAGLVLLWPFLERFFDHVGLLEEKAFRDEAARQRGIGLLQYLATGEAPDAEYLLPLNKVLCGMAPEEVFDFGPPMTGAETEACEELLGAVIDQAPILNGMSLAGFRSSFLLRNGHLGARDDHWLVRVERLTHDVVLDRFPWSARIVKLPWMQAIMQVEW